MLPSVPGIWNTGGKQREVPRLLPKYMEVEVSGYSYQDLSSCNVSLIAVSSPFRQAEMVHTGLKLERALLVTASQCQQPGGVSSLLVGFVLV